MASKKTITAQLQQYSAPWEGIGVKVEPGASIKSWSKAADLDWEVDLKPVLFNSVAQVGAEFKGKKVLYRTDTGTPFAVVGAGYKPVQPKDVLDFFEQVVGEYKGFELDSLGQMRGGSKIWGLARCNDPIKLGRTDQVDRYLLMATSFDTTISTIVQQTGTRLACCNQLAAMTSGASSSRLKFNHRSEFNVERVYTEMALNEQWEAYAAQLNGFVDHKLDAPATANFFMDVMFPLKLRESKDYSERGAQNRLAELESIRLNAPGQKLATAKGTLWGAINAVTFWADHQARSRDSELRLEKAWFGDNAVIKRRAVDVALAMAA